MAKVDLNAVLDGNYEARVGNKYEIAPGKWGTLKPPVARLQNEVFALSEEVDENQATDLDICYKVLDGLPAGIEEDDVIAGMPAQVVLDFFSLLTQIGKKLGGGMSQLAVSLPNQELGSASQAGPADS